VGVTPLQRVRACARGRRNRPPGQLVLATLVERQRVSCESVRLGSAGSCGSAGKRGESISDIGRALDREPGIIHWTIRQYGGVAPAERQRSRRELTFPEREEISRGVAAGDSARRVAAAGLASGC
jgi:hypothetical protein